MTRYLLCFYLMLAALPVVGNNAMPPAGNDYVSKLIQGNQRFIRKDVVRKEMVTAQNPFCAVLACSDSRVAPELIFDQGLGDLFVVRLAGNIASSEALESLDFAYTILGVKLIVVLGHQNCGAIQAVMQHTADQELGAIATLIEPAVRNSRSLDQAISANVREQVRIVKQDPDLRAHIENGSLLVVGAVYNFKTGVVTFL